MGLSFAPCLPLLQESAVTLRKSNARPKRSRTPFRTIHFVKCSALPRIVGDVRHAVIATILPTLTIGTTPMQLPHAPTTLHATTLSAPARSLTDPATQTPAIKRGALNAVRPILPNASDTRLKVALKCFLLAGILSSLVTAATIGVFWVIQDSLVYKPTKVWRGNPKSSGMPFYDDVNYCTIDGVEISGWFIKQPPELYRSARTLIYFHGTDKNASFRLKKVVGFYEQCKCNVLLLSYRGYGLSSGFPNERGMCIDAESALDYLQSRGDVDVAPGGNLWVYGESLGGAVAVHFTRVHQERVNALILENTFTSLLDMIKLEFPILGVFRYLSRNKWQSRHRIRDIRTPILFLSGLRDTYIPPRMMKEMHELAKQSRRKEFVEFEKGTHNRTWVNDGFYSSVAAFMEGVELEAFPDADKAAASPDVNFGGGDAGLMRSAA